MNSAQEILRSKNIKVLVALFLMLSLSCAAWNKAGAESGTVGTPDNIKASTNQVSSSINNSQSNIVVTNPNQAIVSRPSVGVVNYNQGINYNARPQYNLAVSASNKTANTNPFSLNAFFNRIASFGSTTQAQTNINAQKNSMQYNPNKNTSVSVMDYLRTKILRLQK